METHYTLGTKLATFLNALGPASLTLSDAPDVPVVREATRHSVYRLRVYGLHGQLSACEGYYDGEGLPAQWSTFVDGLAQLLLRGDDGELFDPARYLQRPRRLDLLTFCFVSLGDGGRLYSYLTADENLRVGDLVEVPVGPSNLILDGRIERIEYRRADEAPYPLERTKWIIGRVDEDEDDEGIDEDDDDGHVVADSPAQPPLGAGRVIDGRFIAIREVIPGLGPENWQELVLPRDDVDAIAAAFVRAWNYGAEDALGGDPTAGGASDVIEARGQRWWAFYGVLVQCLLEQMLASEVAQALDTTEQPFMARLSAYLGRFGYRLDGELWVRQL